MGKKIIRKEDSIKLWMLLCFPFHTFLEKKFGIENIFRQNIDASFRTKANRVQKGINIIVNDEPVACYPESGPLYKEHIFLVKKDLGMEFLSYVNQVAGEDDVKNLKTPKQVMELRIRINEHIKNAEIERVKFEK